MFDWITLLKHELGEYACIKCLMGWN